MSIIEVDITFDPDEHDKICAELLVPKSVAVKTKCNVTFRRREVEEHPAALEDLFPNALAAVLAHCIYGGLKHNCGAIGWKFDASMNHADCLASHLLQRGTIDPESRALHEVACAWRALALLETALLANGHCLPGRLVSGNLEAAAPEGGTRLAALAAVEELRRADALQKQGKFPKTIAMCDDFEALAVLVEEVGEVAHEVNETIGRVFAPDMKYEERLRTELIQVAAMAIGWAARLPEPK